MTTEQGGAPSASAGEAPAPDPIGTIRDVVGTPFVLCDKGESGRRWVPIVGAGGFVDGDFWRVGTRPVVGAVPGTPAARDPRDAEIERLRAANQELNAHLNRIGSPAFMLGLADLRQDLADARTSYDVALREGNEARESWKRADAEVTRLTRCYDAVTARADEVEAERDRLRQELDLQHADRLRWLCQALNVNPANETWLTAMRRVRHLRQNFSDSPRCEVAESDGWRCRLFAGHDGKHLAQMPTGERREWPFDNRLTPRYWRAGDPEPEIGTTVRTSGGRTYTRRTAGDWHRNGFCLKGDLDDCGEAGYSWAALVQKPGGLVEVVSTGG